MMMKTRTVAERMAHGVKECVAKHRVEGGEERREMSRKDASPKDDT